MPSGALRSGCLVHRNGRTSTACWIDDDAQPRERVARDRPDQSQNSATRRLSVTRNTSETSTAVSITKPTWLPSSGLASEHSQGPPARCRRTRGGSRRAARRRRSDRLRALDGSFSAHRVELRAEVVGGHSVTAAPGPRPSSASSARNGTCALMPLMEPPVRSGGLGRELLLRPSHSRRPAPTPTASGACRFSLLYRPMTNLAA